MGWSLMRSLCLGEGCTWRRASSRWRRRRDLCRAYGALELDRLAFAALAGWANSLDEPPALRRGSGEIRLPAPACLNRQAKDGAGNYRWSNELNELTGRGG